MKILKLRLQNLNSLAGEWEIDFTDPVFAGEGLFAITGATGAGKSTILDALCLALYGQTPRLGRISKSSNEIISRRTGECLAEVTFAIPGGTYRCCWYQRRARKKAAGELQNPQHELVEADSGKIIAHKLREVTEQVEALTGLDFERFTRSMLLAQGSFAVFLEAKPDERAPILEEITGTEIYTHISKAVHERWSAERKKKDELTAALAGLKPLSPEEEREIGEQLREKNELAARLQTEIATLTQTLNWLETLREITAGEARLQQDEADRLAAEREFAPQREKLAAAGRARPLEGDYKALELLRQEGQKLQLRRRELESSRPARQQACAAAQAAVAEARNELAERERLLEQQAPILHRVRGLDLTLREKRAPLNELAKQLAAMKAERQNKSRLLAEREGLLTASRKELAQCLDELAARQADEKLVAVLAGLKERFAGLEKSRSEADARQKAAEQARQLLAEAEKSAAAAVQNAAAAREELAAREEELARLEGELAELRQKEPATGWQPELEHLNQERAGLERVQEALRQLQKARERLTRLATRETQLADALESLAPRLAAARERMEGLIREERLAEENCRLAAAVAGFTEARQELVAGRPCPLCGAREHPFAESGAEPAAAASNATAERLEEIRKRLAKARDELSRLEIDEARKKQEQQETGNRLAELRKEEAAAGDHCKKLAAELALIFTGPPESLAPEISRRLEANRQRQRELSQLLQEVAKQEQACARARQQQDQARQQENRCRQEANSARHNLDQAEKDHDRLQNEAAALQTTFTRELADTGTKLRVFGISDLRPENFTAVLSSLEDRRQAWLKLQEKKVELEKRIAALNSEVTADRQARERLEREIEALDTRCQRLEQEIERLQNERRELFGERDPESEEEAFKTALKTATEKLEAGRNRLAKEQRELDLLDSRLQQNHDASNENQARLKGAAAAFRTRLETAGFADETAFLAARLTDAEYRKLEKERQELERRQSELDGQRRELARRRAEEEKKKLTELSRDELCRRLQEREEKRQKLTETIGACRERLAANQRLQQQRAAQLEELARQKRECEKWDRLHELIGSGDGKKFRIFAQGLTFQAMIAQANRKLQEMSDRYRLIQSQAHPLELDVIDAWQGGEIRTTRNLSGGESFIVSLALALGLSQLAGNRIRIDSLFLDEGFGTLDDEALDTALEALSRLQQDGKLIGVISHVPALRERIATQITVTPTAGGRSRISGPGCRPKEKNSITVNN